MQLQFDHTYTITASAVVDLPPGKAVTDIESCFIKWGALHIEFSDGTSFERDIGDVELDSIDWKRPSMVAVYEFKEGEPDYGNDLACQLGLE